MTPECITYNACTMHVKGNDFTQQKERRKILDTYFFILCY